MQHIFNINEDNDTVSVSISEHELASVVAILSLSGVQFQPRVVAIRVLREFTGLGLMSAKRIVDFLDVHAKINPETSYVNINVPVEPVTYVGTGAA